MNLADIILSHPKLSRADLATLAAIMKLGPKALRAEIAATAQITPHRASQCFARLAAEGLLDNERIYDRKSRKTRSTHLVTLPNGNIAPLEGRTYPIYLPNKGAKLPNGNPMNHDHDDDERKKEEKIRKSLSFFDPPGLDNLLKLTHLTPEMARAWADYKKWRDINGWGDIKKPIGYIFKQIQKGVWPVIQQELPEAAIDLTDLYQPPPTAKGIEGLKFVELPDGRKVWR